MRRVMRLQNLPNRNAKPSSAIAALGGWLYDQSQQTNSQRAKTLIPPSEVELSNLKISSYFGGEIFGNIKNNSKSSIDSIELFIRVSSCKDKDCIIIGTDDVYVFTHAPPGQMRGFSSSISIQNMAQTDGVISWTYEVKTITADMDYKSQS